MSSLWKSTPRFSPPWSSMNWTHLGGAMTSCPISGIPASTTWWAQPSNGTKTDQTASPSFRLQNFQAFISAHYIITCEKCSVNLSLSLIWRLCGSRMWSWTPAWRESGVRTTGTSVGRSRAPASRGWCGSTGKLSAGFWPVREEHGPTSMTISDFSDLWENNQ